MQTLPGGHLIEHEPATSASTFRVVLVEEIGVARVSVHMLASLYSIPFNLKKVYATH